VYKTLFLRSLKERDHSEDLGVDGRIILKCILRKYSRDVDFYSSGSGSRLRASFFKLGNEPSGLIKGGNFLNSLAYWWLLKQVSVL
jgi:hypothetical protein